MKKITSLVLVAAVATMKSVNAQGQPYNEGKMEGYQVAEQKWIDDGSTCSDAWKLEDNYDAYFISGVYSNVPGDNWEERLLLRGARDGVREFVANAVRNLGMGSS